MHGLRGLTATPLPPAEVAADAGPVVTYAPERDGEPDPGEVVWGWVPYEDDPTQGKDRPVLLLGHEGGAGEGQWLGLMLTSKDHTREGSGPDRYGRVFMDVGTGDWDRERRPSEVRLDRLVRLDEASIRREGAALDRSTFDGVVARATQFHRFG